MSLDENWYTQRNYGTPPLRESRTPVTEAGVVICEACALFVEWFENEEKTNAQIIQKEFFEIFVHEKISSPTTSGDAEYEQILFDFDIDPDEVAKNSLIGILNIACAYAIQAVKEKDINRAWTFVVDAKYFLGSVKMANKNKELIADFAVLGRAGAQARHSPMRELKEWTITQYKAGKWPLVNASANKAAHDLKDNVIEQGKIFGANLSPQNAQRTIAEWIRQSV